MKQIFSYIAIITLGAFILIISSCAETFQLSVSGLSGGSVTMSPSGGVYTEGTIITLTAQPSTGYSFTGWGNVSAYSTDSATSRTIDFVMPAGNVEVSAGFVQPGEGWLFMIYMAGDNSLSSYVADDINEIEAGLYDSVLSGNSSIASDVKVLILADTGGSADTRLYLAAPDDTSMLASTVIYDDIYTSSYEANMADSATLKKFMSYGFTKFPSAHNALVLWNHGGGVRSLEPADIISKEICEDDGDYLYMNELQTALGETLGINPATGVGGTRLDAFGFDACVMGEVENAYELRNLTDYFVASMAEEWGNGWGYEHIFNKFTASGWVPTAAEMADIMVSQYYDSTDGINTYWPNTMTAVKSSAVVSLKTEIDLLAKKIHEDGVGAQTEFESLRDASVYYYTYGSDYSIRTTPYHDLYSFCTEIEDSGVFSLGVTSQADAVKTALGAAVVAGYGNSQYFDVQNGTDPDLGLNYYETSDAAAVRGLSIFISHGDLAWNTSNHYSNQWWYTSDILQATIDGGLTYFPIGGLDFCTYDDIGAEAGTVESWREIFEAWYDNYPSENSGDGYTIGTY